MKLLLASSLTLMGIFLSSCGNSSSDQWHDYGNGMINLANVSYIKGKISLTYRKIYDIENIGDNLENTLDYYQSIF